MTKMLTVCAVLLGCSVQVGFAAAQDAAQAPNLKGSWVGTSDSVMLGRAPHHGGDVASREPRLSSVQFTITIDGQDGRRFWGTLASPQDQELFIGVVAFDGKTVLMRDTDGTLEATLVDADTMELIYSHATEESVVVAANRLVRQK